MRTRQITMTLALAAAMLAPISAQNLEVELQRATQKETVTGDLKAAIDEYKKIASHAGSNRKIGAQALIHMAECYQKMGDAESRKIYAQVVRDYADQKDAVAMAHARLGGTPQPRLQTNTLVWSSPRVDFEGRVSPDGRYLSYTDWDSGDLAIHEIATGTDRRLTDTKQKGSVKIFAEGSAISRDGKHVAYQWYDSTNEGKAELRLASLSGDANPRRLYNNPDVTWLTPWDWSPDGKWVAVDVERKDRTVQLGLVSVEDGALRVLKSLDWRGSNRVFFSPDGKYLGYDLPESEASPQHDVFVLAVDGTHEIPAVVHRGEDRMMGWSPDGKRLLFASDRTGSMGLWGLPFADRKPQGAPELIKADIGNAVPLGLTGSGALYYATGAFQHSSIEVASFDFAAGKLLSSPADVTQDYRESNSSPRWSPDGKFLAYVSERGRLGSENTLTNTGNRVIVIRSAETRQVVRELPVKMSYFFVTNWAPDGRSFLAQGTDFKGRRGIFEVDAQTGDVSPLVVWQSGETSTPPGGPSRSPDGKSIYFNRRLSGGEVAFFQRDLASGNEKEVIRRPFLGATNVSPDGQYFATPSVDPSTNSRTVLLIPVAGGEPQEMMRVASEVEPGDLQNFSKGVVVQGVSNMWAPDSRSFLTVKRFADRNRSGEVWRVPVGGGVPSKLDLRLDSNSEFSAHTDGRRIAYTVSETGPRKPGEVWVLENFLLATSAKK